MGSSASQLAARVRHSAARQVDCVAAADAAVENATAMTENAHKLPIARTAVKRAIIQAAGLTADWK